MNARRRRLLGCAIAVADEVYSCENLAMQVVIPGCDPMDLMHVKYVAANPVDVWAIP